MRAVLRFVTGLLLVVAGARVLCALEPKPGADAWLTNAPAWPAEMIKARLSTNPFITLRAEAIAGRLRVSWESATPFDSARVIVSADAPGHWPARDWRSITMKRHGTNWQAELPVDSLDVPLIYSVIASNREETIASPLRIAWPGALGLEQPTRLFWPFVEGFEQGTEGWRAIPGVTLRTDGAAKHGRAALRIEVPAGERSVTIVTTRLRGWFIAEHRATGLELWLKTRQGKGVAAFELLAHAFTTNQVLARRLAPVAVNSSWTKVELPWASFPKFPLGEMDLLAIELTGAPGTEFLIDDVQWLGRWRSGF